MATAPIRIKRIPDLPTDLVTVTINPRDIFRVSSYSTGEPHFGVSQQNRFDSPAREMADRYGTCYFGATFGAAVAETLLHNRVAQKGYFHVESAVILARYHISFQGSDLILADLTGAELKRMGGHAGLCGTSSYKTPQNWSAAIHAHPDVVDGFRYVSRHLNDAMCYVVFCRAAHKLSMDQATPLASHPDFGAVATALYINNSLPTPRRP